MPLDKIISTCPSLYQIKSIFLGSLIIIFGGCANLQDANLIQIINIGPQNPIPDNEHAISFIKIEPTIFNPAGTIIANNLRPYTYIAKFTIYKDSTRQDLVAQRVITLEPYSRTTFKILPNEGKVISLNLFWYVNWEYGDNRLAKETSGFIIPLPKYVQSRIIQSPDGPLTTHKEIPLAIDFSAPVGTPILASKAGKVIRVEDNSTEGGPDIKFINKANYINILNEDGSIANYVHLQPHSARVKINEFVKQGDIIGQVGLTGYTYGPHLHFGVYFFNEKFIIQYINPQFSTPLKIKIPIIYGSIVNHNGDVNLKETTTLNNLKSTENKKLTPQADSQKLDSTYKNDATKRLLNLKDLLNKGLINQEDYDRKKLAILKSI